MPAIENPNQQTVTTERTTATPNDVAANREERPVSPREDYHMNVAGRIIWLITGIIMGLLALRFLLRLLGANPSNGFADLVYKLSHPLASPFFGLFSYTENLGQGRFEFETLIAILVYALIGWVLVKLVTIGKRY